MNYIGADARHVQVGRTRITILKEKREKYRGRYVIPLGTEPESDWADQPLTVFEEDMTYYTVGIIPGTRTLIVKKDDAEIV